MSADPRFSTRAAGEEPIETPPAVHPAALSPLQLLEACQVRRTRRSGPGGQHRNKVETAVIITHRPTGFKGEASERRSQAQNHRMAVFRLRVNLALEVRCRREPAEVPSLNWQSRCPAGRIQISPQHDDFPALLAEALDVLAVCEMDVKTAAATLQTTPSQLTRFLQLEPRALAQVNAHRRELGLRALR
jgi:hypothetical protein